jgi:hypothetical protein
MVIEALKAARDFIESDRQDLAESLTLNGEIVFEDDIDRGAMAEYVKVLAVIDEALNVAVRPDDHCEERLNMVKEQPAPVQEPVVPEGYTLVTTEGYEWAKKLAVSALAQQAIPLTELQKDATNLLFALHDAWPYVHQHCTIQSKKKFIQALIVKHGDFADLQPTAQPAPTVQEPVAGLHAVYFRNNWDGEGDLEYLLAYLSEKGEWTLHENGAPLIEFNGDEIIKTWPLTFESATQPAAQPAPCTWTKSPDPHMPDTFDATCGVVWTFSDGGPVENDMHFCPGCGAAVSVSDPEPEEDLYDLAVKADNGGQP